MKKYIFKRILQIIPVLIGVSLLTFILMRVAPGDAAYIKLEAMGAEVTPEAVEYMRNQMGLNRPILVQYFSWLKDILSLNFGNSLITGQPVIGEFSARFGATVRLTFVSMSIVAIIAIPVGIFSAMYYEGFFDNFSRIISILIMSIPTFCLGLLMILLFSIKLNWLPSFGDKGFISLILPSIALSSGLTASYSRLIRSSLLDELSKDYIRAARARGVRPISLVTRHALKNALTPIITAFGIQFGILLGGTTVVETVFSWPGMGKFMVDSVMSRDYTIIQSYVLFIAIIFVLANLIVDIICMFLNPKMRRANLEGSK